MNVSIISATSAFSLKEPDPTFSAQMGRDPQPRDMKKVWGLSPISMKR